MSVRSVLRGFPFPAHQNEVLSGRHASGAGQVAEVGTRPVKRHNPTIGSGVYGQWTSRVMWLKG
jgi:hypothetical protein